MQYLYTHNFANAMHFGLGLNKSKAFVWHDDDDDVATSGKICKLFLVGCLPISASIPAIISIKMDVHVHMQMSFQNAISACLMHKFSARSYVTHVQESSKGNEAEIELAGASLTTHTCGLPSSPCFAQCTPHGT